MPGPFRRLDMDDDGLTEKFSLMEYFQYIYFKKYNDLKSINSKNVKSILRYYFVCILVLKIIS